MLWARPAVVVQIYRAVCEFDLDEIGACLIGGYAGIAAEVLVGLHKQGGEMGGRVKCLRLLLQGSDPRFLVGHGS